MGFARICTFRVTQIKMILHRTQSNKSWLLTIAQLYRPLGFTNLYSEQSQIKLIFFPPITFFFFILEQTMMDHLLRQVLESDILSHHFSHFQYYTQMKQSTIFSFSISNVRIDLMRCIKSCWRIVWVCGIARERTMITIGPPCMEL